MPFFLFGVSAWGGSVTPTADALLLAEGGSSYLLLAAGGSDKLLLAS